jgi:hypothetical protein
VTAERYLAHLDGLTGGVEPHFLPVESSRSNLGRVFALCYTDLPEPGMLTAFTYGLSQADHPDWRLAKPELCISVQSTDVAWALAMGHLADSLRGTCPFSSGNTIAFGDPISDESAMTDFVVFAPISLAPEAYLGIDVGDDLPISIAGLYPIHESERCYIRTHGLEAFWTMDWDPYDPSRTAVV